MADISQYVSLIDGIVFIGVSNGALIGAQQGWKNPEIKEMLLINGPLMINWPKTKNGIEEFGGEVQAIIGTQDPSFPYVGLLELIDKPYSRFSYDTIEGVDHTFSNEESCFFEIILFIMWEFDLNRNPSVLWIWAEDTGLPYDFYIADKRYSEKGFIHVWVRVDTAENYIIRVKSAMEYEFLNCIDSDVQRNLKLIAEYVQEKFEDIQDYRNGKLSDGIFHERIGMSYF